MSLFSSFESNFESISHTSSLREVPVISDLSTTPFKLEWSFGLNSCVPVLNLGTKNRSLVAYACSHMTIFYDYESREMFTLQGHRNSVCAMSADSTGKWLLTADFGKDSTVVIWDTISRVPICTLFNPHEKHGMTAAALCPSAKYVVTVSNEKVQIVKFWLWTFGRENGDVSVELLETGDDRVKDICFSCEDDSLVALTLDHQVVFVEWNREYNKVSVTYPAILKKPSKLGKFTNSTFIPGTKKAFTGANNGFIVMWEFELKNQKGDETKMECSKLIQLQKADITKVTAYKGMLVTGNSQGHVIFYDENLKKLYWLRDCGLNSISSISFDRESDELSSVQSFRDANEDILEVGVNVKSEEDVLAREKKKECIGSSSNITMKIELTPKPKGLFIKSSGPKMMKFKEKFERFKLPRDATLESNAFLIDKFIVATSSGQLIWVNVSNLEGRFISNYFESPLTAIDTHPERDYLIIADKNGKLFLFNYKNHRLLFSKSIAVLPNVLDILKSDLSVKKITYLSNITFQDSENLHATVVKYSPTGNILICALENGFLWVLHPDTLEPFDPLPYKHSSTQIVDIIFSECSNYMAYFDKEMTVVVFKKNEFFLQISSNYFNFIGKYKSHYLAISNILFGTPISEDTIFPRLLSLGEDQYLVEYDLAKSGPYPEPGLRILKVHQIELHDTPLCMCWYPKFGLEQFLTISNSDYKFKLIEIEKLNLKSTVLGPLFSSPVKKMMIRENTETVEAAYMIFATDKEIGLQLLPFDGNPFKIVGMIGHPRKILWVRISHCSNLLFTLGQDDQCVFMWKVNFNSVDVMNRLGGAELIPFYGLIKGGKEGWLFNEMKDLFVFGQILQQGENSMKTRSVSDQVSIEQLPNLLRAIGFYPSEFQLNSIMRQVMYKNYPYAGETINTITFDEIIKLYINHRPTYGISSDQLKNAFIILQKHTISQDSCNASLSREEFVDILSEFLNRQQLITYLKRLVFQRFEDNISNNLIVNKPDEEALFFLPKVVIRINNSLTVRGRNIQNFEHVKYEAKKCQLFANLSPTCKEQLHVARITYQDFASNILGIESTKEPELDTSQSQIINFH